MKNNIKLSLTSILFLFVFSFGVYLCYIGGYGSDEDTLPMIGVFISILKGGDFMTSRFTGYPVAEMVLGFLSYNFGSFYTNLATYINLIIGLALFYLSFEKKFEIENIILFLLLCMSNPVLFFDNLEPMDYSWALVAFSAGLFFLSRNYYELAIIFFGLSIGVRLNFALFVIVSIIFFDLKSDLNFFRRIIIIALSIFVGGLFYIPVWYQHQFSLEWLTAARPTDQGYFGLFARFIYKIIDAINILPLLGILYLVIFSNNNIINLFKKNLLPLVLIISNLLIFFYIPAELSYLQIFLISFFYLIYKFVDTKIVYFLIILNFISWAINFQIVEIKRVNNNICEPVQALNAKLNFNIIQGDVQNFLESRDLIKCWIDEDSDYGKKIISGKPLK